VTSSRDRVELIDYARFFAALAVVFFHYFYNGMQNGKIAHLSHVPVVSDIAQYGYIGVDIFFLISGFVIASSAIGRTARSFIVGRAVRLFPAFWPSVLMTTLVAIFLGGKLMSVSAVQVAANLTMVPQLFGQPFVDGVYWTLAYELAFYALVAVLLIIRQGDRIDKVMSWWAIGMALISFLLPSASSYPFLGNYFMLFATGAVISAIRRTGWTRLRVVALLGCVIALTFFESGIASDRGVSPGVVVALCLSFVCVLLATGHSRVSRLHLRGSSLVGRLTYPVYLIHAYIGYMLINALATEDNKILAILGTALAVFGLAYMVHMVFEVRMRPFWYFVFDRSIGVLIGVIERARATSRTRI